MVEAYCITLRILDHKLPAMTNSTEIPALKSMVIGIIHQSSRILKMTGLPRGQQQTIRVLQAGALHKLAELMKFEDLL